MLSKVFPATEHMGYFKEHFKNLILVLLGFFFFLRCKIVKSVNKTDFLF